MRAPDDPAAAVVARDEVERAWDAIDRLPEERRRALVLRFVEEMSAREIGEVLGRSEGAVRVLIHRALRSVADELAAATPRPSRRGWRPPGERPSPSALVASMTWSTDEASIQVDTYLDELLASSGARRARAR